MTRLITYAISFGGLAAIAYLAPWMLPIVALIAAHAWAQAGTGPRAPDWLDRA